jgi:hypothetical protein
MATPQQVIDGYLGEDAYDEWQELARRTRIELDRSARLRSIPPFIPVASTIVSDTRELEVIAEDYDEGMKQILGGSKVDPQEMGNIAALYTTALDLVEFENDTAEAVLATGVAKAFVLITFDLLAIQAARFEAKLKALEQSLQQAKRMVREAKTQAGLDALITLVTVVVPEVRVVAAGMKLVIDYEYGPKKPGPGKVAASAAWQTAQSLVKIKDTGDTTNAVLKKVGKGGAVVAYSLYSDWGEIADAEQDLSAVKADIRTTQAAYQDFMRRVKPSIPALMNFISAYQRGQQIIDQAWRNLVTQRSEFYDQARALNFSFSNAWVWKTVP